MSSIDEALVNMSVKPFLDPVTRTWFRLNWSAGPRRAYISVCRPVLAFAFRRWRKRPRRNATRIFFSNSRTLNDHLRDTYQVCGLTTGVLGFARQPLNRSNLTIDLHKYEENLRTAVTKLGTDVLVHRSITPLVEEMTKTISLIVEGIAEFGKNSELIFVSDNLEAPSLRAFAAAVKVLGGRVIFYNHGVTDPDATYRAHNGLIDAFFTWSFMEHNYASKVLEWDIFIRRISSIRPIFWASQELSVHTESEPISPDGFQQIEVIGNGSRLESNDFIDEIIEIGLRNGLSVTYRSHPKMYKQAVERFGSHCKVTRVDDRSTIYGRPRDIIYVGLFSTALVELFSQGFTVIQVNSPEFFGFVPGLDVNEVCDLAKLGDTVSELLISGSMATERNSGGRQDFLSAISDFCSDH
jgi:hypothetical protein